MKTPSADTSTPGDGAAPVRPFRFALKQQRFHGPDAERGAEIYCDMLERRGLKLAPLGQPPLDSQYQSTTEAGTVLVEWRHDGRADKGLRRMAETLPGGSITSPAPPCLLDDAEPLDLEVKVTPREPPVELPAPRVRRRADDSPAPTNAPVSVDARLAELAHRREALKMELAEVDELIHCYGKVAADLAVRS